MSKQLTEWKCEPQAEALLIALLEEFSQKNKSIAQLADDLHKHTSSRLFDWIDHLVVSHSTAIENELEEKGFVSEQASASYRVFSHPGAQLPRVVLKDHSPTTEGVAVRVDSIADFLMIRGLGGWIEGSPLSRFRRCSVATEHGVSLWVIERRGTLEVEPVYEDEGYIERYLEAMEKWETRPRGLDDEDEAMSRTLLLADELIHVMGPNLTAWIVLECERKYWQARNTAAQIQKSRQDRMGMGWANHDHHTFRSSRKYFSQLVRLFEMLGFHCRERFYAGEQAGWGAQVMENSTCGLVLFLDLDLAPDELEIDFAHHTLPELRKLGTVGLWCALHGDSILKSGMHHLEAQFLFQELAGDLSHHGISMMEPFSNFPYLKQAFTAGEQWVVDHKRIAKLADEGRITRQEAEKFISYGAVGSHLENLQRREGYKGFNQKNVSYIIAKTDPRKLSAK